MATTHTEAAAGQEVVTDLELLINTHAHTLTLITVDVELYHGKLNTLIAHVQLPIEQTSQRKTYLNGGEPQGRVPPAAMSTRNVKKALLAH